MIISLFTRLLAIMIFIPHILKPAILILHYRNCVLIVGTSILNRSFRVVPSLLQWLQPKIFSDTLSFCKKKCIIFNLFNYWIFFIIIINSINLLISSFYNNMIVMLMSTARRIQATDEARREEKESPRPASQLHRRTDWKVFHVVNGGSQQAGRSSERSCFYKQFENIIACADEQTTFGRLA